MLSHDYLPNIIQNLGDMLLVERDKPLSWRGGKTGRRPFLVGYHPEINFSPELDEKVIDKHMYLIGILQWSNEIDWIDITTEVSMLSQHQWLPQ